MGLADPQEDQGIEGEDPLYAVLRLEEAQDRLEQQQQEAEFNELQQDDETDWDEEPGTVVETDQEDDDW
jgi:hypothetical protein